MEGPICHYDALRQKKFACRCKLELSGTVQGPPKVIEER
jgi:hypothetical protein